MKANIENVKRIMIGAIAKIPEERSCECKTALKNALI
jgi:hypothetical protein